MDRVSAAEFLIALFKLRGEGDRKYAAFFRRISAEFSEFEKFNPHKSPFTVRRLRHLSSLMFSVFSFVRSLPLFTAQLKKICAAQRNHKTEGSLIIAISSRRLYGNDMREAPRRYLSGLLVDSFSEESEATCDRLVLEAPSLFLVEPERQSPLWNSRKSYWKQGVFIVDANFLLFVSGIALLTGRGRRIFRSLFLWRAVQSTRGKVSVPLKAVLVATFVLDGYEFLFGQQKRIPSLFLTSNSFLTEVLRFYLLEHGECHSLCEVMHGVPTTTYEHYLAELLSATKGSHSYEKHSSISPLPHLPVFGILESDVKLGGRVAINTYLNRYVLDAKSQGLSWRELFELQFSHVFPGVGLEDKRIIITFIGGASMEESFFESKLFKLEKVLLEKTIQLMGERPFTILYSPHPANCLQRFRDEEFFKRHQIFLASNTIFTWFVSDLAIGTFSGALFEFAYFGAETFATILPEDEAYPDVLLDLIDHQKTRSLEQELSRFVLCHRGRIPVPFLTKIKDRSEKLVDSKGLKIHGPRGLRHHQRQREDYGHPSL